jgi:hypothetical protein
VVDEILHGEECTRRRNNLPMSDALCGRVAA